MVDIAILSKFFYRVDSKELGFLAENIAARYLEERGYEIIAKNYRKPWGELDIVSKIGETVVFVEVKANRQDFPGDFNPEVRVDERKIHKIKRTAALYLERELGSAEAEWRIDIIAVTFDIPNKKAKIKHFKNV
jgi:putative endonuclease